jgi:hypothetical protein
MLKVSVPAVARHISAMLAPLEMTHELRADMIRITVKQ